MSARSRRPRAPIGLLLVAGGLLLVALGLFLGRGAGERLDGPEGVAAPVREPAPAPSTPGDPEPAVVREAVVAGEPEPEVEAPGLPEPVEETAGLTLRVVDARTGRDLTDVLLLNSVPNAGSGVFPNGWGEEHVALRGGVSPIAVGELVTLPVRPSRRYWATAPGYRWGDVYVDPEEGGERRLALAPDAGALEVAIRDLRSVRSTLAVHAVAQDGATAWRWWSDGELLLPGLPAGAWEVRLQVGEGDAGLVLDRLDATVVPGGRTGVRLTTRDPQAANPGARLTGSVIAPEELGAFRLVVERERQQLRVDDTRRLERVDLEQVAGRPGVYRLPPLLVTPGFFRVSAAGLWGSTRVEVGPEGADFELELRALARVRVRSIDGATGEPRPLSRLGFRPAGVPESELRWVFGQATEFELDLPLGDVVLSSPSAGVNWAEDVVRVTADGQELELRSRERPGFRLRLVDGDVLVPPGIATGVRVTTAAGTRRYHGYHAPDAWYVLDEPGLVRVELEDVPGYAPIPRQELLVEQGAENLLEIGLVRD